MDRIPSIYDAREELTVEMCKAHIRSCKLQDKCSSCPYIKEGHCGIVEAFNRKYADRDDDTQI